MTVSLTLVIPTRNRAELAQVAVRALLDHRGDDLRVLVSDNSSDEAQAEQLSRFCRSHDDSRLTYLRAADLTMPQHWDWALEQALARGETSHYAVHYDRKVAKPGHIRFLMEAIERRPEHVVTYVMDQVNRDSRRWVLWQTPWTGQSYEIPTARVARLASEGRIAAMGQAFPILSNCAVPRRTLERIRARFGDICDSTGPDAAFTFRLCALEQSYVHFDRPLAVIYGIERSNGAGYLSGSETDFVDFKTGWGDRPWQHAAPLPELDLGWNVLFHEYELVRRAVGDVLPPLSPEGYLEGLAWGLGYIVDPRRREAYEALLEQHGWRRSSEARARPPAISVGAAMWRRRTAVAAFVARTFGIMPKHANGFRFATEPGAVRFALRTSRRRAPRNPLLDPLLQA
jgi:glycosyltransferase involved in cell wall biosynthesis